ncbi:MAG: plastocyanin/azurin family copper-binding protein [archaeon]|jgi:plastocyanin
MKSKAIFGLVLGILLFATLFGCTQSTISTNPEPQNNAKGNNTPDFVQTGFDNNTIDGNVGSKVYSIRIENFAYYPAELTIKKGDTVAWQNYDSSQHTVTSDIGTELDSGLRAKGSVYQHTFNTIGEYAYHCTSHPSMKAKIIVE